MPDLARCPRHYAGDQDHHYPSAASCEYVWLCWPGSFGSSVDRSVIWVCGQHANARLGRIGWDYWHPGVTWRRTMWCTGESRFRDCARVRSMAPLLDLLILVPLLGVLAFGIMRLGCGLTRR